MASYDAQAVKALASNRWKSIFLALAPSLHKAVEHAGQHVPCPVHGGTDGFRLFPKFNAKGDGICNTCGAKTDGLAMLQWVNNWSFSETVNAVGDFLQAPQSSPNLQTLDKPSKTYEGYFESITESDIVRDGVKMHQVCLTLQYRGRKIRLYGADLKRVCSALKLGEYVRLSKIAFKRLTINHREAKKAIWSARVVMSPEQREAKQKLEQQCREQKSRQCRETLNKVYAQSVTLDTPQANPVQLYWANRGIAAHVDEKSVRCVPAMKYFENGQCLGEYPCMICAVKDAQGHVVTLHRTYLTGQGRKAPVHEPKKIMCVPEDSTINGCAIRLVQTSAKVIAIAEGVETALSVITATGLPCWSTISEGGMRRFEVPEGIETVLIFADKDRSGVGQQAAKVLQERLQKQGIRARIFLPRMSIPNGAKSLDWNDVLQMGGKFPSFF